MASIKKIKPKRISPRDHAATGDPSFARRTITIPHEMEATIDSLVGRGKFSAFAQRAFQHEIQRESIARWLDDRQTARNDTPLSAEALRFAEDAWQRRK